MALETGMDGGELLLITRTLSFTEILTGSHFVLKSNNTTEYQLYVHDILHVYGVSQVGNGRQYYSSCPQLLCRDHYKYYGRCSHFANHLLSSKGHWQ